MADNEVKLILSAVDRASGVLKGLDSSVQGNISKFMALSAAGLTVGAAYTALRNAARLAIDEAGEAEQVTAKLTATFIASAGAAGMSTDSLNELASSLSRVSGIDDEVFSGAQSLLLTFDTISGETFPRVMQGATDLSAVMGTDLRSAVMMLGRALASPAEGMMALRRAGVILTEAQKEQIKTLVASGQTLKAQGVILDILEGKVGGAAKIMGETFVGAAQKMETATNNLAESIGTFALEPLTIFQLGLADTINLMTEYIILHGGAYDAQYELQVAAGLYTGALRTQDQVMQDSIDTWLARQGLMTTAERQEYVQRYRVAELNVAMSEQQAAINATLGPFAELNAALNYSSLAELETAQAAEHVNRVMEAQGALFEDTYIPVAGEATTASQILAGAIGGLAAQYDAAQTAAGLLAEGIQAASDSAVDAERTKLVLKIATEDMTEAEIAAAIAQLSELEAMENLNTALETGKITKYQWITAMSDGVVTQEEVNTLLGLEKDALDGVDETLKIVGETTTTETTTMQENWRALLQSGVFDDTVANIDDIRKALLSLPEQIRITITTTPSSGNSGEGETEEEPPTSKPPKKKKPVAAIPVAAIPRGGGGGGDESTNPEQGPTSETPIRGATGFGGLTIGSLNIYAAPGMSEYGIAQAVAAELGRLSRNATNSAAWYAGR